MEKQNEELQSGLALLDLSARLLKEEEEEEEEEKEVQLQRIPFLLRDQSAHALIRFKQKRGVTLSLYKEEEQEQEEQEQEEQDEAASKRIKRKTIQNFLLCCL